MSSVVMLEPKAFANPEMDRAEALGLAIGKAAVWSRRCPGKPSANEDSAAVIPVGEGGAVLVVADGLGGEAAGERASRTAVEVMCEMVRQGVREGLPVRASVLNGFEEANRAIERLGVGAATTMAVVEVQDREIRPYHVGDSVILVVGGRGKIKLETLSHSPVGYAVAAGMLDAHEAMHHNERHVVSNVIGSPEMRIEVGPASSLKPRDTVVLASDGLSDNLHSAEIAELIRKGRLDRSVDALAQAARLRMETSGEGQPCKPDDLTIVAFRPTQKRKEV